MILYTKNNWLRVELFNDAKEEAPTGILLPEDYKPAENPYKAVSVGNDPHGLYKFGDVIVVPTHVIREVTVRDQTFYLVERAHIMGLLVAE